MTNPTDPQQTNGSGYDPTHGYSNQPMPEATPGGWSVPTGQQPAMPQQPAPYGQPYPQGYQQQPGYPPGVMGQPQGFYAPLGMVPVGYAQKSKVVAALLAFFFGGFGIHDFYCGYNGRGVMKILTVFVGIVLSAFTLGLAGVVIFPILGFWALLDFLFILLGAGWYTTDARGVALS